MHAMIFLAILLVVPTQALQHWVETSLVRVMPNQTAVSIQQAATIALAGNEHESFQIALLSETNMTLGVTTTSLKSSGKASLPPPTCGQVGLMYVSNIMANSQGGTGWWPEVVLNTSRAMAVENLATSLAWVRTTNDGRRPK